MSDGHRRGGTPPPDVERLAELDAGLLDDRDARAVRAAAHADPAARAVLAALAATRAELAALPDPSVPPAVAARWSAALRAGGRGAPTPRPAPASPAAGSPAPAPSTLSTPAPPPAAPSAPAPPPAAPPAPPLPPDAPAPPGPTPSATTPSAPASSRPAQSDPGQSGHARSGSAPRRPASRRSGRRRAIWRRPAVLAAAALLVILAVAALLQRLPDDAGGTRLVQLGLSARGLHDAGNFASSAGRAACLAAVHPPGVAPTAPLLGARRVAYEGRDGVLFLLGTGAIGTFDVVVVDPGCSALLGSTRFGG